jgi:hypothetical protein
MKRSCRDNKEYREEENERVKQLGHIMKKVKWNEQRKTEMK